MNASLFRSWHAVVAALLVVGFYLWGRALGTTWGWQTDTDRGFLLWSGWVAFTLYLVLWAYAARKAAHRTRWSFEFARAVPVQQLEQAQARLSDLRVEAFAGRLTGASMLAARATSVLAQEKVDRVLAAEVTPGADGKPPQLTVRWRQPLGRLARWMHAHLYYGVAAAVLVTLHGGLRFTSPMALALNALSLAVIGTGLFGIVLWTFGPAWLSAAEGDLNYERADALRQHYARKVAATADALRTTAAPAVNAVLAAGPAGGAAFLAAAQGEAQPIARDLLTLLGQRAAVDVVWQRLSARRAVLNTWRLVHVPLSIALVLVVLVHVFSVWIY